MFVGVLAPTRELIVAYNVKLLHMRTVRELHPPLLAWIKFSSCWRGLRRVLVISRKALTDGELLLQSHFCGVLR